MGRLERVQSQLHEMRVMQVFERQVSALLGSVDTLGEAADVLGKTANALSKLDFDKVKTLTQDWDRSVAALNDVSDKVSSYADSRHKDLKSELRRLDKSVNGTLGAISGIRLPDLDTSPVLSAIASLERTMVKLISELEREEREDEPKKNYTFKVNRGPGGFIRTVDVTEQ